MRNPKAYFISLLGGLTLVAYQNCGKQMSFQSDGSSLAGKGELVTHPPVDYEPLVGEASQPPTDDQILNPPTPTPAPTGSPGASSGSQAGQTSEDVDTDHMGNKMLFNCAAEADSDLSDVDTAPTVTNDIKLNNVLLSLLNMLFYAKVRDLDINKFYGTLQVDASATARLNNIRGGLTSRIKLSSHHIEKVNNVRTGIVKLRTAKLESSNNVNSFVTSIAAREIGVVNNSVSGHVCLSAQRIGKVHNVGSVLLKAVGRSDGSSVATAEEFSNLGGFISLAKLDIGRIHNLGGYLIIRDSEIDEISNVSGKIVLINSKVHRLANANLAVLAVKNSTVVSQEGVTVASEVTLP